MEQSMAFYQRLGFREYYTYSDDNVLIEHLKNREIILELFCYKTFSQYVYEPSRLSKHSDIIGYEHFSLAVESIREAYDSLQDCVERGSTITMGRTGIKYFFIVDPNGSRIEIVEDKRGEANEQ
ncbi:MAG: hypothetical protein J6Y10_08770 [Lachnospiraceae bacterium]|nr:hypothetical protein [Lachnospiraceae bacterium]